MSSLLTLVTGVFSARALALATLVLGFSSLGLLAQSDQDPFSTDPIDWDKASFPLPWGVVGNLGGFVWGEEEDDADASIEFGVDVYYDAWQLGFHHEQWGDVFRLMTRSVGRDYVNYGFFLEYGWHSVDTLGPARDSLGVPIPGEVVGSKSHAAIGGGFRYGVGYSDDFSPTWAFEISLGSTHLRAAMPMSLRLPIDQYAASLVVTPQVLGYAIAKTGDGGAQTSTGLTGIFGVWLSGKFALNLERE